MTTALRELFPPMEVQAKMDMTAKDPHACKISMLWNWYTIDSCFIARSWHVTSRGMFAGTCIGVFFWVVAYCWFHRFIVEFDNSIVEYKLAAQQTSDCNDCCGGGSGGSTDSESNTATDKSYTEPENGAAAATAPTAAAPTPATKPGADLWTPLLNTFSHKWYLTWLQRNKRDIYPSPAEHLARSGLYLMEWTVSYLIMLMWMYYNGYLIITMILGYFFGQLLFNYTPLATVPLEPTLNKRSSPSCM